MGVPGELIGTLAALFVLIWVAWVKLFPPRFGGHELDAQPPDDQWTSVIPKDASTMAHALVVTVPRARRATRRVIRWTIQTLALAFVTLIALFILVNALLTALR